MRLRALGATSFLIAFLLLAPSAWADEEPTVPAVPLEPVLEDLTELVEEAEDQLQPEEPSDEEQAEEEAEERDQPEAREEEEDTTQQALETAAALDESVEHLLTELDLLDLEQDSTDEPVIDETENQADDEAFTPATQTEAAPRQMDLVTTTLVAAAAVGTVAAAGKAGFLRFLSPAALGLFSRFQGPRVLDNPRRAELNGMVCKSPGITVPDLCQESGLSRNAVLHHLRMLEDQGMIVHRRMGRSTHWFENGGRYGRERKDAYAVLHDDRTRDVAQFILRNPGSHQGAIGSALGLSPSVVHWHMKRLEDALLVERERVGRSVQCFPGGSLADLSL